MSRYWKLANRRQPDGVLSKTDNFVCNSFPLRCVKVGVPTEIDAKRALANVGQLASVYTIRSLEMWWDSRHGEKLDIVLVSSADDVNTYKRDFLQVYPNATFEESSILMPEWYDPAAAKDAYQIWDVGYRHGHLSAVWETRTEQDVITRLCNTIQQASCAWIQITFGARSFVGELQSLMSELRSQHKTVNASDYVSTYDMLSVTEKLHDHPEKGKDFATHFSMLESHTDQKAQGEHVMVSMRGLLKAERDIRLDLSGVRSVPMQTRSFEYLVQNQYEWPKFLEKKIRIWDWCDDDGSRRKKRWVGGGVNIEGIDSGDVGASVDIEDLGAWWKPALESTNTEINNDKNTEKNKGRKKDVRRRWWRRNKRIKREGSRLELFTERLLPDPAAYGRFASKYVAKSFFGRYKIRASPPFILMTLVELGLLVRLPDVSTPNLTITRRHALPQQQLTKTGFCLGFVDRSRAVEYEPFEFFGKMVEASAEQAVVLSTADIATHLYVVGGTKSGKTTMIRCIAKHMELANLSGEFPNAFIVVDPKGSDSYDFLLQCEAASYKKGDVTFLDPIDTRFSINVLELPPYDVGDDGQGRQVVVSQYVGYIMQMIEYWYHGSDAFVRLKRILDTLLQYIYLNNDKPTFLDIYEIIVSMQKNGREMLVKMFKELGKPESALEHAIESVAGMEKQAYEPALNRLEKFATDPILRHMFCVRESTVDFDHMVRAGSYTVIRLSPLNIPQHIITLAKQTLVIKLWFVIQERAERIKLEKDRTQVLLALDEFQDVAGLPVIEAMLTQSRSYGLGLLLAHQTTTQLDDSLFEVITGNVGTQFVGRVSGRDGGRFGDLWDPSYSRELKSQLATQEYHHWTARLIAGGGQTQPLPVQFWPVFTNLDGGTNGQEASVNLTEFIASQKKKFGSGVVDVSMVSKASTRANQWLANVPYEPPSRDEWEIMCILAEEGAVLRLNKIVQRFRDGTTHRDSVSSILRSMHKKKLIGRPENAPRMHGLPLQMRRKYMEFDPSQIGKAEDIPKLTEAAVSYYLQKRWFLCVAPQTIKKDKYRTDLVAYDYENSEAISVEIESAAEMAGHPEHVRFNMRKWVEMGFQKCHVWSTNPRIREERERLPDEIKRNVQTFVIS